MPTPVFVCGAECGSAVVTAMGGVNNNSHWQTIDTGITVDSTFFAPGGSKRSYKIVAAAQGRQLGRTLTGNNIGVARFKVMWTTLPNAAGLIAWFDGVNLCGIRYNSGNLELYDKTAGTTAVGPAVVAGRWYTIDLKADCNQSPWALAWQVDGVPYGTLATVRAAQNKTAILFGNDISATQTMYVDDIVVSNTLADYPFGDGVVLGLSPVSDGLHSFTANDFKYNNTTAFAQTVTDTFTYMDETIDNVTDYITQAVIRSTGYVEVRFAGLPFLLPNGKSIASINGLALVGGFHATTTSACTCSLRVVDGSTETAVFALLSPGATTIVSYYKCYATAPTLSLPWSRLTVNGLLARFGFSTDVTPFPSCDALMLEVDCVPAFQVPQGAYDLFLNPPMPSPPTTGVLPWPI